MILAVFIYAIIIAIATFPGEYAFTDNQYNHGLVARSALESSYPLLETSYLHWYFYEIDAVRAEDWHRSTYLLVLAELHRLAGEWSIVLTKLVFIAIVLANLYLISLLAARAHARPDHPDEKLSLPFFFMLIVPVMLVNSWMPRLLAGDYLDDMPAALCGFVAATLLVIRGPRLSTCVALGLVVALAFSVKNLSLVLSAAFLLSILVTTALECEAGRIWKIVTRCATFCVSYAIGLAPTLYWNIKDLGLLVPEQARLGLIGRLRSDTPDGEHDLYFLKPDLELAVSWIDMVLQNGLVSEITNGFFVTLAALRYGWVVLLVTIFGLLGAWFARNRRKPTAAFRRLTTIFIFTLLGFVGFFTLKLGEAGQLRYWIFTFGLGAATGVSGLVTFYQAYSMQEVMTAIGTAIGKVLPKKPQRLSTAKLRALHRAALQSGPLPGGLRSSAPNRLRSATSRRKALVRQPFDLTGIVNCLLAILFLTLLLNAVGQSAHPASSIWRRESGYPIEITERLTEVAGSGAIIAHTNIGVHYWIDYPMTSIVGLGPRILVTLTADQLTELVERYGVTAAVYRDWERLGHADKYKTVEFLLDNGFCEDSDAKGFVVLRWEGRDSDGGLCGSPG